MPAITVSGIGSGLDIDSIVEGLMEYEQRPLDLVESKISTVEAQISAFGQLKSNVATFQSAMEGLSSLDKFKVYSPTSSDESVVTASADNTAVAGSYNVTVTQLAQNHKLASTAFTDASTVIGEGTLTISVGSNSFDITIDSDSSSLNEIKNKINSASDNTGVTATLINEDGGSRLILTSDETGVDNAITVSATNGGSGDLSQLATANLTEIQGAKDASFYIDDPSFVITSSSNSVSGAIEGVTLNLSSLGTSTVNISRDDEAITESVQAFVDAYNTLKSNISSLRDGTLEAENTLLNIESQLTSVLNKGSTQGTSAYQYLFQVGVSITKNGELSLDTTTLQSAMNSDFDSFASLFADETDGFATQFDAIADALLETDGLIDARQDGLNSQLDRLEDQQERIEYRLDLTEERIRAQFSTLDTLISQLNATGDYLTQQFEALNNS